MDMTRTSLNLNDHTLRTGSSVDTEDSVPAHFDGIDTTTPGEAELQDRLALRRVNGLSTELHDITEVEYRSLRLERVVLIGVWTSGTQEDADNSLFELKQLAETAGAVVLAGLTQRRSKPDPATYIGSGKAAELRDIVEATGADTVICDGELTPASCANWKKRSRSR